MIWITGDIHGDPRRFSVDNFPEQKEMTKDDYVIILGDFGLVWNQDEGRTEKYWLDWLEDKPFTTLFICGNHENFERLYKMPVERWNGGLTHVVRPHIRHLMRGEVFNLQDHTFFAFGGARSHDISDGILDPIYDRDKIREWYYDPLKMFRIDGISWWKEEMPSEVEMNNGMRRLERNDWKVDYILTHSPSSSVIALLGQGMYEQDELTRYLEKVKNYTDYKRSFAGHMHINKAINDKDILLYEQIIRIV